MEDLLKEMLAALNDIKCSLYRLEFDMMEHSGDVEEYKDAIIKAIQSITN